MADAGPSGARPGDASQPSPSSFSSPKKRIKQSPLHGTEKQTVLNIYKHVKETWSSDSPPYQKDLVQRTTEIAGVSRATVYNILKEYKEQGRVKSPPPRRPKHKKEDDLDEITLNGIRRTVHSFFFNNELPTLDKVLNAVNSDDSLPNFSRTGLYRILKNVLQFDYLRRSRKSGLIDENEIMLWRIKYLQDMQKFLIKEDQCIT